MRLDSIKVIVDEDGRTFKIQFLCHSLQGDTNGNKGNDQMLHNLLLFKHGTKVLESGGSF